MGRELISIHSSELTYVMWMVNDSCPFKCWYCPETTWNGSPTPSYDWETCSHALDVIFKKYKRGYFTLNGGEPTSWPYYTKVLEKFNNEPNWNLVTMSNMSKSLNSIKTWASKNAQVAASFHPNVINTEEKRRKWFDKVLSIKEETLLQIRLMWDPLHFDALLKIYNDLNDDDIYLEPARIVDLYNDLEDHVGMVNEYTPEQNKILGALRSKIGKNFRKRNNDPIVTALIYDSGDVQVLKNQDTWDWMQNISVTKKNRFKGWSCSIGLNNLYIDPKGNIAKAVCKGARQLFISNFDTIDHTEWPDRNTRCIYEWCFCDPEILISKRKN